MKSVDGSGADVKVKCYGGEILPRVVVADLKRLIIVCSKQEFHRAVTAGCIPIGVGFPRDCVFEEEA